MENRRVFWWLVSWSLVKVGAIPSIKMALDKGAKSVVLMSGVTSEFKTWLKSLQDIFYPSNLEVFSMFWLFSWKISNGHAMKQAVSYDGCISLAAHVDRVYIPKKYGTGWASQPPCYVQLRCLRFFRVFRCLKMAGHMGRPDGKVVMKDSLKPVAKKLEAGKNPKPAIMDLCGFSGKIGSCCQTQQMMHVSL